MKREVSYHKFWGYGDYAEIRGYPPLGFICNFCDTSYHYARDAHACCAAKKNAIDRGRERQHQGKRGRPFPLDTTFEVDDALAAELDYLAREPERRAHRLERGPNMTPEQAARLGYGDGIVRPSKHGHWYRGKDPAKRRAAAYFRAQLANEKRAAQEWAEQMDKEMPREYEMNYPRSPAQRMAYAFHTHNYESAMRACSDMLKAANPVDYLTIKHKRAVMAEFREYLQIHVDDFPYSEADITAFCDQLVDDENLAREREFEARWLNRTGRKDDGSDQDLNVYAPPEA